ncbi:MAG: hypothetical protein Q7T53_11385 [Deltaproteobacteria bacterium]|nr:hypothetical protein [Deltaproteobacteria bacterium]
MFEICKDKSYVPAEREQVARLMMSFNEPMVAPSRHSAQPTQAYICTLKEGEGFSVYIYLYLTIEKIGILYEYTDKITDTQSLRTAEDEALQFTDDMGFIVDDLNFEFLEISEQNKLLASIPLFKTPAEVVIKERTSEVEGAVREAAVVAETITEKVEEEKIEELTVEVEERQPIEEGKKWEPELFLTKFRIRAAAERMKKNK